MNRERILVVEDDPGMRRAVVRVLEGRYDVEAQASFHGAEEVLRKRRYQLALVDLQLGDGDGYTLCQRIRGTWPETDVILMTGSITQPDEKLYRSLEEDAFYFLFKPFERRVLLALVERCLRLQRERRAKESFAQALAEDLERARRFQRSLLPAAGLALHGWQVDGRFVPCDALGGDLYFCLDDHAGGLVVAVSDVVGHGVSAAMYAGMLRAALDAARRRDPDPERVAPELLAGVDFFQGARYATLFYGRLLADGRLRFFNAGHPPALLLRGSGGVEELRATGPLLTRSLPFPSRAVVEVRLEPGDRMLIYTDGLFEARDGNDRELGRDGVEEILRAGAGQSADELLDGMLARLDHHRAGRKLEDDVTVVLVERKP